MRRINPFDKYHIDEDIKKAGIWFDDEDIRMKVTYAGTENSRYEKMLKLKMKPHQDRINADRFPDKEFYPILAEVYAATVVLSVQVKSYIDDDDENGEWIDGLYDLEGNIIQANEFAIAQALAENDRLFKAVIKIATNFNLFRKGQKDEMVKNS